MNPLSRNASVMLPTASSRAAIIPVISDDVDGNNITEHNFNISYIHNMLELHNLVRTTHYCSDIARYYV